MTVAFSQKSYQKFFGQNLLKQVLSVLTFDNSIFLIRTPSGLTGVPGFTEVDEVTKKERIAAEIEKTKAKRQELTERITELERRFKEEETFEMHELLRKAKVTPEELAEILEKSPLTRKNREA